MSESSSMPWVKLYTEIIHDAKLRRLTDAQKWRFVQLICLAGKLDAAGAITNGNGPYSLEDIAWELRVDDDEMFSDMGVLIDTGLVTIDGDTYTVTAFDKRQGRGQAEKRENWRKNQRNHRENVNVIDDNVMTQTPVIDDSSMSHTPREEKRREEKNNILSANADESAPAETKKRAPRPPTQQELAQQELAQHFQQMTKINLPEAKSKSDYQAAQVRWWKPIKQILEQTNYDMSRATYCMDNAIQKMRRDRLTISAPQSILSNALSVYQSQEAL